MRLSSVRTTQDRAIAGLDGIAQDLLSLVISARDALPHAPNGQPPAPSSTYVANVRREMKQGRSQEFRRLYAVAACDLADGVPFSEVIAPYRRLIAQLEVVAVAGALRKPDRPTPTLVRQMVKESAEAVAAGVTLVQREDSPEALQATLREVQDLAEVVTGVEKHCERALARLAVSRGMQRPMYGQRHTIGAGQ